MLLYANMYLLLFKVSCFVQWSIEYVDVENVKSVGCRCYSYIIIFNDRRLVHTRIRLRKTYSVILGLHSALLKINLLTLKYVALQLFYVSHKICLCDLIIVGIYDFLGIQISTRFGLFERNISFDNDIRHVSILTFVFCGT